MRRVPETRRNDGRILPKVAGRASDLPLLAVHAREHLNLGANSTAVVVETAECQTQPVIFVATFIVKENGRAVILSNKKVGAAVVVVISSENRARILQTNFVEAYLCGYVAKALRTKVAEQAYFATTVGRFAHSSQVHPAVVVVVERGNAPGANPVGGG